MSPTAGGEYIFVCPACNRTIAVDGPMRGALIEAGCVVCAAPVTGSAFTPGPSD